MINYFLKINLVIFSFLYLNLQGQEPLTDDKSIPVFKELKYRNVGPTRGGRVTSVCGVNNNQFTFYMGTTGGGLWKSTDAGLNWNNISDGFFKSPSIGAIRVYQKNPSIIYVGTGSDGIRSNVIVGKGIYKSIDEGKSWSHIGLQNVGQIGAVETHPNNPDIVYVAAIGQPFQPNEERGLYKSLDGGKTWENILFISNKIGIVDIEISPDNPNIIYAASWRGERKPWTIISGSEEGGIYKSLDAGKTWKKLKKGLPKGLVGKIDLATTAADPDRLYALIEAEKGKGGVYTSYDRGKNFSAMSYRKELVNRPFYYCNLEADPKNADIIFSNANRFMMSNDAGKTWKIMRTPHGDNHDIWINPNNTNIWIQSNDGGANITFNGGKSWTTQFNQPTAEIYQVEVDNQYPYWLYGGQQDNSTTISVPSLPPYPMQAGPNAWIMQTGGCETGPAVPNPINPNIVYSNCKGKFGVYNKETGQEKQFYVGAANMYGHNPKDLKFRFQRVSPIHISPHDEKVIYHGSQFVHKTVDQGITWEKISPDLTEFDPSKQVISGSPITRDVTGEEFYSTIYSIRESNIEKGQIWVGSNDGLIHITRDGGESWKNVTPKSLKKGGRVDSVEPSKHEQSTAFVTVLRYQLGDWSPYIYKTNDYGETWKLITNGIPSDFPVRVVREDPNKKGLLYAGTEFGIFISRNGGENWESFQQNLPITPITDLKVHRDDIVLSTMGRSFWILDRINFLHHDYEVDKPYLVKPSETFRYRYRASRNSNNFYPQSSVVLDYYLESDAYENINLSFYDKDNNLINSFSNSSGEDITDTSYNMELSQYESITTKSLKIQSGLNRFRWDMRHRGSWDKDENKSFKNGPLVCPGKYKAVLSLGEKKLVTEFIISKDPKLSVSNRDLRDLELFQLKVVEKISEAKNLENKIEKMLSERKLNKREKSLVLKAQEDMTTKEGTYMQPMLVAQYNYLYSMLSRSDQEVGNDAHLRLKELNERLEKNKKLINSVSP